MTITRDREIRFGLPVFLVLTMAACGGGGGTSSSGGGASSSGGGSSSSGGGTTVPTTYSLVGSVSGLSAGSLVLAVSGRSDVNVSANGNVTLASGLASGAAYAVSVKTQPAGLTCQLSHASGNMPAANVSDVAVACAPTIALVIDAPANNTLVPLNTPLDITFTWTNTTPPRTNWSWTPEATSTLAAGGATGNTGHVTFQASAPGTYTVTVASLDDTTKKATITLRVHQVYSAIDAFVQDRTYLRADGRAIAATFDDVMDTLGAGAPTDALTSVSTGWRFRMGLKADGTVVAWGSRLNQAGQESPKSPPAGLTQVSRIAASSDYSLALKNDGTLAVWGRSSGVDTQLPGPLAGAKFIAADAGDNFFAAISETGELIVWNGSVGARYTNPAEFNGKTFTQLCATQWHVVAVDSAGAVLTWNVINSENPEMDTPPATSAPVARVFCGSSQAALVQTDGRLMTWGSDLPVAIGRFDSSTVAGWPRVKGASLVDFQPPRFLTEGGAIIDVSGNVVTAIDSL